MFLAEDARNIRSQLIENVLLFFFSLVEGVCHKAPDLKIASFVEVSHKS